MAWLGVAMFGVLAVVYVWASPSLAFQNWDSLDYAWTCEARGSRAMWGNHPLVNLVACGVVGAARRLGYEGRALPVMQVVNGVTAAAAVSAMLALLTAVLGVPLRRSVGWAVVFGAAFGWWHQAGTADYYSLAVLLVIVAWGATIRAFERPSLPGALLAGLAVGAATVAHQFGGVMLAVGTLGLLPFHRGRGRARSATVVATLVAAAVVTIVAGYGLCGTLATGSTSPTRIVRWMIGHGAEPSYGRFFDLDGAFQALGGATATLVRGGQRFPLAVTLPAWITLSLGGALAVRRLPHRERTLALSCALQWVAGSLLITWWEPRVRGKFWLLMLPALVVWCELVLAGLTRGRAWDAHRRALEAVPAVAGAAMFLATGAVMLKERQPDAAFERALRAWAEHSRPADVLIESGRLLAHLRYWERRSGATGIYEMLRLGGGGPDRFAALRAVIAEAAREGRAVLFAPGLSASYTDDRLSVVGVTRQQVDDFFGRYAREGPLFEYREGDGHAPRPVYRLIAPVK